MNKRWELFLPQESFEDFTTLMEEHICGGFTSQFQRNDYVWVICYPSEEAKLLARLRFDIKELVDKFGINVDFTDWPNAE